VTRVDRGGRTSFDPRPPLPRGLGWALGSGTILQGFNSSIIAVALVSIGAHFGQSDDGALVWLVSGMYIACAVASPSAGRFVDLFGPRRLYLIGLGIVLAAAVAGPFMPSLPWLVADRIVMGIGASVQFPAAMAIIRRLAAEREASGRTAIGTIALCGQTLAAIGPSVGGVLVVAFGWQSIFWVNLPLVLNAAVWVLIAVPTSVDRTPAPDPAAGPAADRRPARGFLASLDLPGLLLFVIALVCLMWGLLGLDDLVAGDPLPLVWCLASVPVWALFVIRELRAALPFVDVRLLIAAPQVLSTCGRAVVTFLAFYGVFYGLPQWLEASRGLTAAQAGLLMIPVFGTGVVSTLLATRLSAAYAPRTLLVVGGAAFAVAGALLAMTVTTQAPIWLLIVVGALLGLPNGFNNLGNQSILQIASPASGVGIASGLYRTAQYVGAALSAAVVALLLDPGSADGGIRALGAVIGVVGLALMVLNLIAGLRERRTPLGT
jgi:MFS family permease